MVGWVLGGSGSWVMGGCQLLEVALGLFGRPRWVRLCDCVSIVEGFFFLFEQSWFGLYGSGWVSQYSVGNSREVCDGGQWQCGSDTCHGVGFAGKSEWWIR